VIRGQEQTGRIVLKPGQILYDNDPRYRGRKLEVARVEGSYAVCTFGPRQVKVRLDYMFSDGNPTVRVLDRFCWPKTSESDSSLPHEQDIPRYAMPAIYWTARPATLAPAKLQKQPLTAIRCRLHSVHLL